jgi:hypothetical protein
MLGTVLAQSKQAAPRPQSQQQNQEQVTGAVKQLLLLMDTDKNGKISKQEWMSFMSVEFDRLDKDKNGELTTKELAESKLYATTFAAAGK